MIDCLIIGAGGAGCRAAIALHEKGFKPIVFTQKSRTLSKTFNAQGGIQASFSKSDSVLSHFEDTMKAGNYKSDPKVVEVLTQNARAAVLWLENEIGVVFDKDEKGGFKLSVAGGLSHPRIVSCKGSAGERIAIPLWEYVDNLGIQTKENKAVIAIKEVDNGFIVDTLDNGVKEQWNARTIILAAGGAMPEAKKAGKLGLDAHTPDGVELAEKIGATVNSPLLMQYHPTGVVLPNALRRLRLPETMRGLGAYLTNKNGEQFTDHLAIRSKVTEAIVNEVKLGNGVKTENGNFGVWMHTEEIDKINGTGYLKNNFEKMYASFLEYDFDISKTPVIVYPIVHYSLGGVTINEKAETNVSGLFAAGEVTWGVHGEDRLMGNSLLDIFVFGKVAGDSAAHYLMAQSK